MLLPSFLFTLSDDTHSVLLNSLEVDPDTRAEADAELSVSIKTTNQIETG